MKKFITTLLSLALVIGMCPAMIANAETTPTGNGTEVEVATPWDGTAAESFATGDGSPENPYQITSAAELKLAANTVNKGNYTACFILMNDIDYENNAWEPIGYADWYTGSFDGNKHVVRNLSVTTTDKAYTNCGFFGGLLDTTVTDLGIENIQINLTNASGLQATSIGGFAGIIRRSTVSNCFVKNSAVKQTSGSATETHGVGGFAGDIEDTGASVTNCYVYNVAIQSGYGKAQCGFVANIERTGATITNCYADTTALTNDRAYYGFGYVGRWGSLPAYSECYSTSSDNASADTTKTFGTLGQSVGTIAAAFAGNANWQDGTNINAGLPALAWEIAPAVVPDPYVVESISLETGTVTLTINKADTAGDQVYIATYDSNDRLVSVDVQNPATTVTTTVTAAGAAYVKVFVWNGLTPVINAVVKDL